MSLEHLYPFLEIFRELARLLEIRELCLHLAETKTSTYTTAQGHKGMQKLAFHACKY